MSGYLVRDLAKATGLTKQRIHQLIQSGEIKADEKWTLVGKHYEISADEYKRFLAERHQKNDA